MFVFFPFRSPFPATWIPRVCVCSSVHVTKLRQTFYLSSLSLLLPFFFFFFLPLLLRFYGFRRIFICPINLCQRSRRTLKNGRLWIYQETLSNVDSCNDFSYRVEESYEFSYKSRIGRLNVDFVSPRKEASIRKTTGTDRDGSSAENRHVVAAIRASPSFRKALGRLCIRSAWPRVHSARGGSKSLRKRLFDCWINSGSSHSTQLICLCKWSINDGHGPRALFRFEYPRPPCFSSHLRPSLAS